MLPFHSSLEMSFSFFCSKLKTQREQMSHPSAMEKFLENAERKNFLISLKKQVCKPPNATRTALQ